MATIRELLNGNIADVRLSAREASTALSIIQIFANAVDSIAVKLARMEELAKKASSPDYSQVQIEAMQKELQDLATEINDIVKRGATRYSGRAMQPVFVHPSSFSTYLTAPKQSRPLLHRLQVCPNAFRHL